MRMPTSITRNDHRVARTHAHLSLPSDSFLPQGQPLPCRVGQSRQHRTELFTPKRVPENQGCADLVSERVGKAIAEIPHCHVEVGQPQAPDQADQLGPQGFRTVRSQTDQTLLDRLARGETNAELVRQLGQRGSLGGTTSRCSRRVQRGQQAGAYDTGYERRDWPTEKDLGQPRAAHATASRVHDERPDRRTNARRAEKKAQTGRRPGHQARPPLAKFWWLAGEAVVGDGAPTLKSNARISSALTGAPH